MFWALFPNVHRIPLKAKWSEFLRQSDQYSAAQTVRVGLAGFHKLNDFCGNEIGHRAIGTVVELQQTHGWL
jgi:hypothetical protein